MSTVIIIHGIGGNPEENWFPWLKRELDKEKHRVIVPQFPHTDAPQLDEWREHLAKYAESIDEHSIIVGHSLGAMFALRYLERATAPIRATLLVASVTGPSDGKDYAPLMTSFTEAPLDIAAIRKNAGKLHVFHADNDPYIALGNAENLAKNLGAKLTVIPNGGHLGSGAGFSEFPALRDSILSVL